MFRDNCSGHRWNCLTARKADAVHCCSYISTSRSGLCTAGSKCVLIWCQKELKSQLHFGREKVSVAQLNTVIRQRDGRPRKRGSVPQVCKIIFFLFWKQIVWFWGESTSYSTGTGFFPGVKWLVRVVEKKHLLLRIYIYIYTGCFTTLGHNCRRCFPRSLWSKKFI